MLKISIVDSGRERRLMLEGKLIAPWTTELQRACDEARQSLLGREIGIDLKNLTVISQEGENLLAALMKEGIKVRGSGVFAREVLRTLRGRARVQHQEPTS
jgi:indole-3-glycerol phosphate synthase